MTTLAKEKPADAIKVIDLRAKLYADQREVLAARVAEFNAELEKLRRLYLPAIRKVAARCAELQDNLEHEIKGRPDLFTKPRTMTLHGIRLGIQKCKGVLIHSDTTEAVVERIKKHYGDEADQYLIITEKPRAATLMELSAGTLKKFGLEVRDTGDVVFIKAADTEVDKLVSAILKEGAQVEEEQS